MDLLPEDVTPVNGTRRAATLWVAGVGAVLMVVAAGWFVALQWNNIPDEGKLAIILVVTAAFIVAGRRSKRSLPATASVLFHLGLFLIPVDLAAVNLRVGLTWQEMLLAEGVLGMLVFGGASLIERSIVLRSATVVSVFATALGIGATTPVPAPVALAVAAVALSIRLPRADSTVALAVGAGYLPLFALPFLHIDDVPRLISSLGIPRSGRPIPAIMAGVLSAVVIGRAAHLRRERSLALIGVGAAVASGITAMVAADLSRPTTIVTLASMFVVVELIALAIRDEFWTKIASGMTVVAEAAVVWGTLFGLRFIFLAAEVGSPRWLAVGGDRATGVAFAVVTIGWAFATFRYRERGRDGTEWRLTGVAAALTSVVAVQMTTRSVVASSIALAIVGGLLFLGRHLLTDITGLVALLSAVVSVSTVLSYPFAIAAGAFSVAAAYVALRDFGRVRGILLLESAIVLVASGAIRSSDHLAGYFAVLSFIACAWLISLVIDRVDRDLSMIPRVAAVLSLAFTSSFAPEERLIVAGALIALLVVDAVWTRDGRLLYGLVIPLQVAVFDVGSLAGLDVAYIGVASTVAAIVWAGLGEVVGGDVRKPAMLAAGIGATTGLALSAMDPVAFGISLLVTGGVILGVAVLERSDAYAYVGGLFVLAGLLTELGAAQVAAIDAYVAPVAAYLLGAGALARRRGGMNSWVAYAPGVVLMGSAALIERINGGSGWHAVVAGSVGVVAVAIGGWRRLAGPLFVGTALLACVVGFESLAVTATVPTWAWLALGGAVLLGTGVTLERKDLTPAAAGRRVVEVIAANFD